jgi:hypothetical protein
MIVLAEDSEKIHIRKLLPLNVIQVYLFLPYSSNSYTPLGLGQGKKYSSINLRIMERKKHSIVYFHR